MCNESRQPEHHRPETPPIKDTNPDTNQTRPVNLSSNNNIVINNIVSDIPTNVTNIPPSQFPRAVKCLWSYNKSGLLEQ